MKSCFLYDLNRTFDENLLEGPFFNQPIPKRIIPDKKEWHLLFDYKIMSRFGIAACPFIANERGMKLASDLGYDILTWKTIRSKPSPPHPHPNVTFVENSSVHSFDQAFFTASHAPDSHETLSCANSIGNASYDLQSTLQRMEEGKSYLKPGQLFITSIYGTGETPAKMIQDFVHLAVEVQNVGAQVIELNLSCPNVSGMLYHDPGMVKAIGSAVTKAVTAPVTIKVGLFPTAKSKEDVLIAAARSGIRGITGINTVPFTILSKNNVPFFGEKRKKAGVSGAPIRPLALSWLKEVKKTMVKKSLDLTILAGGGITMPNQIDIFFEGGADAVMAATGALANPLLAHEYHRTLRKQISYQETERAL